jgi:hypothetical protein
MARVTMLADAPPARQVERAGPGLPPGQEQGKPDRDEALIGWEAFICWPSLEDWDDTSTGDAAVDQYPAKQAKQPLDRLLVVGGDGVPAKTDRGRVLCAEGLRFFPTQSSGHTAREH